MKLIDLDGKKTIRLAYTIDPFGRNGIAVGLQNEKEEMILFFFEGDNDGYRSELAPILSGEGALYEFFSYQDEPDYIREPMTLKHSARASGGFDGDEDDVLQFISDVDGHIWLEVGTSDIADYYPSFVCRWNPRKDADHA